MTTPAPTPAPDLTAQAVDVHVELGGQPVLHGVDLAVHEGETVALMGPNGSGKSTLARLLDGLVTATTGQVLVDDQHIGLQFIDRPQRVCSGGETIDSVLMDHQNLHEHLTDVLVVIDQQYFRHRSRPLVRSNAHSPRTSVFRDRLSQYPVTFDTRRGLLTDIIANFPAISPCYVSGLPRYAVSGWLLVARTGVAAATICRTASQSTGFTR